MTNLGNKIFPWYGDSPIKCWNIHFTEMEKCKPVTTPLVVNEKLSRNDGDNRGDASIYRSLSGSLLYLSITRLDIMFPASLLSKFMQSPSQTHFCTAKQVFRYTKGTANDGLQFLENESRKLQGYVDTDWVGYLDD